MSESSRAWSWRHAFSSSSLPATTKHVLHTLGMFMNEFGEGCYPSVADICRYSGLDKKTVMKHLATARDAGWIAVSQHGYRGQKWKRNEYAARWPERNLTAPCPPGEGGGANPPPPDAANAVESVPEGGGTEGPKVVEEDHQDKTTPETTPRTSPVSAPEGARERGENGNLENSQPDRMDRRTREALERRFWKMVRNHPQASGMPKKGWLRAWLKLSPEKQDRAEARHPAWLELLKQQGRSYVPKLSTYFEQELFEEVPEPEEEKPPVAPVALEAKPFGPLWQVARMKRLLHGPSRPPGPMTDFQRHMVESGKADEADIRREQQTKSGWPEVNSMHQWAIDRKGVHVAPELEALSHLMEAVPVGSETYEEWRQEHERRGWPWVPDPGAMRVVYFPRGGPAGLTEFEAALRSDETTQKQASEAAE